MGYVINTDSFGTPLPPRGKANALLRDGAFRTGEPTKFRESLVCVIQYEVFDTAVSLTCEQDLHNLLKRLRGIIPHQWLIYNKISAGIRKQSG